jgi:hypothetical protein
MYSDHGWPHLLRPRSFNGFPLWSERLESYPGLRRDVEAHDKGCHR